MKSMTFNKRTVNATVTTLMFTLMLTVMQFMNTHPALASATPAKSEGFQWSTFKTSLTSAFQNGLGGEGMQGIGIAIAVIGVVAAGISFAVHKFNPQSRMPGWITCLVIGIVGSMLMLGMEKPLKLLESARDWVYTVLGV